MKRKASAEWQGGLKDGKGKLTTESGVLSGTQYSFSTRFENGKGTNPEELIGAAHAGCFSMALSMMLGQSGFTATFIKTDATVTLDQVTGGFAVTAVHLSVVANVPGTNSIAFNEIATQAKEGCPISKLLKGAIITMDAKLENQSAAA